jgi:hypothetical protein
MYGERPCLGPVGNGNNEAYQSLFPAMAPILSNGMAHQLNAAC